MDSLKEILLEEISWYASGGANVKTYLLSNEQEKVYAVNVVTTPKRLFPGTIVVMARIEGDQIIIEEDTTDKPLFQRLQRRGIPDDKIVRAYAQTA